MLTKFATKNLFIKAELRMIDLDLIGVIDCL
jgi:hypothetical protein